MNRAPESKAKESLAKHRMLAKQLRFDRGMVLLNVARRVCGARRARQRDGGHA
jgi:predicted kinase